MGSLKGAIQGAISVLLSLLLLPITLGAVNTLTATSTDSNGVVTSVLGLDSSTVQILSILPIVLVAGAIFLVIRTSWADKSMDK